MDIKFDIKRNSRGFILVRIDGEYSEHAHLKSMQGCLNLIKLIRNNKLPRSKYLRGSCQRLLSEEEYRQLKESKQKYVNVNKGVR
jgi:hypothetical protein